MRRFLRKSASLGLTLLFGASLASTAFGWHGCPHHGHGPVGGDGNGKGVRATTDAPDPAGPTVADHQDAGHGQAPPTGTCTCLGSCHSGSSTALAADAGLEVAADGDTRRVTVTLPALRLHHHRPAYFLPFPHGPPALG